MDTTTLAPTHFHPAGPWTSARPTRAGEYAWRASRDARAERIRIETELDLATLPQGGEWAPARVETVDAIDVCLRMYPATLP